MAILVVRRRYRENPSSRHEINRSSGERSPDAILGSHSDRKPVRGGHLLGHRSWLKYSSASRIGALETVMTPFNGWLRSLIRKIATAREKLPRNDAVRTVLLCGASKPMPVKM